MTKPQSFFVEDGSESLGANVKTATTRKINSMIKRGWRVTNVSRQKIGFGFGETYQEEHHVKITLKKS